MGRVLLVRVGAIGDTLMVTPLIRALKSSSPDVQIDVLCSELAAPLLESNPAVSRLFPLRWRNLPYILSWEKRRLVRGLRRNEYPKAVLLEAAPRYRQLLELAGIQEIRSYREMPFDPELHSVVNNLRVGGFWERDGGSLDLELSLSEDDRKQAMRLLEGLQRPMIGLHAGYGPLSRKKDQSTRLRGWGNANFRQLAQALVGAGASVVLTGSPEDQADAEDIGKGLPVGRVRVLAGRTSLRQLAATIQELDLYVSVDSGPAHIAAAVATPLVVLWGPGKFSQTRPLSSRSPVRVIRHPVPCAPCYDTPAMKTCRVNVCMLSITPERVLEEAMEILPELFS